jgi:tRNA modification GTPase
MADLNHFDTIVAQATPPGRGGIAIVRVSGPLVNKVIEKIVGVKLTPRQATHLLFHDTNGDALDEGIAIFFPHPHSFTGEDVLELHGHGGPILVDLLLHAIVSLGARLARPGEFSERAFLNGKMDLTQAEAIADLIDASSQQAARLALRSLQGDFSKAIHALNEKIIQLRIYVEAAIDFSDEEIDFLSNDNITQTFSQVVATLADIQANAQQSSFLREGITVVIAGEPNVGKSSLLNCLSGQDTAIVTDIPGTTRDVLREHILIDGMPIHIIDTAGLRESEDRVEQEGIRRAYQEIEKADLVLIIVAANTSSSKNEESVFYEGIPLKNDHSTKRKIIVRNKIDLIQELPEVSEKKGRPIVSLSAKTGKGIDLLKKQIKLQVGFKNNGEGVFLARRRHLEALARAHSHLQLGLTQLKDQSGELAAEDLRMAQQALNEITGEFTADDLLGRIFSSFCIGK